MTQVQSPKTEMFTVYGKTDGVNPTGTYDLYAPLIYGTDAYLHIPKGMKFKIHAIRVCGGTTAANDTQVLTMYTHNVTTVPPVWAVAASIYFDGLRVSEDKRKPIIFTGYTGVEAVSFDWLQTVAEVSHLEVDVEYTPV